MSRSKRKPFHVLSSKIDKDYAHKAVRCKVKCELKKAEPDELIIEADTKEMGKEEWGTKFGYEFMANLSEEERIEIQKDKDKATRK